MTRYAEVSRRLAGCVLLAALVAGCQSGPDATGSIDTDDYRKRHPIVVQEGEETLDLAVGHGSAGLSGTDRDRVMAFAAVARDKGTGPLVIFVPTGSSNATAASYLAGSIRKSALQTGISSQYVETRSYGVPDPRIAAPIRLSFTRIKASVPHPCGQWPDGIYTYNTNNGDAEFGCSTQANLAAMVSDPQDLLGPRASTAIPGDRRSDIIAKWIRGEKTASAADSGSQGNISSVGGGN
ncbi:CpaD family pilus assembly protein [Methylobrevis albus]|uniref:CpaD family pilus assembly protein n=1 Tax=Methylobrevis albus TaxID=2793297 RepID=A0A931I263_9HYPH|nr:CpaD family pilus assembly protein [Methylobrevis albus]MBH0238452.1 CpaD family pilus assembly protein [Methylobrevis albus]